MAETLTEAVLTAAKLAGSKDKVPQHTLGDVVAYLNWMAVEHPTAFATLLVEILRKELERGV